MVQVHKTWGQGIALWVQSAHLQEPYAKSCAQPQRTKPLKLGPCIYPVNRKHRGVFFIIAHPEYQRPRFLPSGFCTFSSHSHMHVSYGFREHFYYSTRRIAVLDSIVRREHEDMKHALLTSCLGQVVSISNIHTTWRTSNPYNIEINHPATIMEAILSRPLMADS